MRFHQTGLIAKSFLLLCSFMTSLAHANDVYDLNDKKVLEDLCSSGSVKISGNPATYTCLNGIFSVNNGDIVMDDGGVLIAEGGFAVTSTVINRHSSSVTLKSNYGNANLTGVTLKGSISTTNPVNLNGSIITGDISSDNGGANITISNLSIVEGNVTGIAPIAINSSTVKKDVRTTDSYATIAISNSAAVEGNVESNGLTTITDSEIQGNVTSVGLLTVTNGGVGGNIESTDGRITLNSNARIQGDATAVSWGEITFSDYADPNRSYVVGVCLPKSVPEDACDYKPEPPINTYPQLEFGTIGDRDENDTPKHSCKVNGNGDDYTCTINFENTYTTPPLVFVMPTINAELSQGQQTEYASSVSVVSVTADSATVLQEFAPNDKAGLRGNGNSYNPPYTFLPIDDDRIRAEMLKVDFFVMEEGVLELNGGTIVSGLIDDMTMGDAASQNSGDRENGRNISFDDYGLSSFSGVPGVLVQAQTRNNTNDYNWFTELASNVSSTGFKAALEMSEVYQKSNGNEVLNILDQPEQVAFVAGIGSGYINNLRFWLGSAVTKNTLSGNSNTIVEPIVQGCAQYTLISDAGFTNGVPILVGNKNSRKGNNGGWIRRCDVTEDKVWLVIEEDMQRDAERAHVEENVGFFMFEKAKTEICSAFFQPVQTWIEKDSSNNIIGGDGTITLANNAVIRGATLLNGQRQIGYAPGNVNSNSACNGAECVGNNDLRVNKESLASFPANATSLGLSNNEVITITESGTYFYETITLGNGARLEVVEGLEVVIHTKKLNVGNNAFIGMDVDNIESNSQFEGNFRLNVHDLDYDDDVVLSQGSEFIGLLYSERNVVLGNNMHFYGSIAALDLEVTNNAEVIRATQCLPELNDYEITISPKEQFALMCGAEQPQFTIETTNDGAPISLDVILTVDDFVTPSINGAGTKVNDFTFRSDDQGLLEIILDVDNTNEVTLGEMYWLKGELGVNPDKFERVSYSFVPYKFSLAESSKAHAESLVAGLAQNLTTQVLACDDTDNVVVVPNYTSSSSGNKKIDVSVSVTRPSSGRVTDDNGANLWKFNPVFSSIDNGVSTDSFRLDESGVFTVTMVDDNYQCDPDIIACPIAPPEDGATGSISLNGSFEVKVRPHKIAICNVESASGLKNKGTTNEIYENSGFMPAGEEFIVTYRPIIYTSSSDDDIECGTSITQNYALDSGPLSTKYSVAYPSSGVLGPLDGWTPGDDGWASTVFAISPSELTKSYSWHEAGTLTHETKATYLDLDITQDSALIGRMYPKYFEIIFTEWDEPNGTYTYMNQPFNGLNFKVNALNGSDIPVATSNYGGFDTELQAKFELFEPTYETRLKVPNFMLLGWSGSWLGSQGDYNYSNASSSTVCENNLCWSKKDVGTDYYSYQDGPFDDSNITISIRDKESVDPIAFVGGGDSVALIEQPHVRFGRTNLQDVGGNQGSNITVPLAVEYWDGNRFASHIIDIDTAFDGDHHCAQTIWPAGGEVNARLSGSDVGFNGESRELFAIQGSSVREQVRLWLTLSDDRATSDCSGSTNTTPWLQYDWNGDGEEEDPSTIVTFGIHRGNDRVIYRGEPRL